MLCVSFFCAPWISLLELSLSPAGIITQLNRIIRNYLLSDMKEDSKGKSLAAWDMICKPTEKRGL
jgi:hypothetical protein